MVKKLEWEITKISYGVEVEVWGEGIEIYQSLKRILFGLGSKKVAASLNDNDSFEIKCWVTSKKACLLVEVMGWINKSKEINNG